MIVVSLAALREAATRRPEGYLEEVLAAGVVRGQHVHLPAEAYRALVKKYTTDVPFSQKLKNFTKSAVKHLASGAQLCTEEEVARRHAICQTCEFLKDGACRKCGCPVVREKKFISKLSWANESCPIGKWGNGK